VSIDLGWLGKDIQIDKNNFFTSAQILINTKSASKI